MYLQVWRIKSFESRFVNELKEKNAMAIKPNRKFFILFLVFSSNLCKSLLAHFGSQRFFAVIFHCGFLPVLLPRSRPVNSLLNRAFWLIWLMRHSNVGFDCVQWYKHASSKFRNRTLLELNPIVLAVGDWFEINMFFYLVQVGFL